MFLLGFLLTNVLGAVNLQWNCLHGSKITSSVCVFTRFCAFFVYENGTRPSGASMHFMVQGRGIDRHIIRVFVLLLQVFQECWPLSAWHMSATFLAA
jgi:hypothetical protein